MTRQLTTDKGVAE